MGQVARERIEQLARNDKRSKCLLLCPAFGGCGCAVRIFLRIQIHSFMDYKLKLNFFTISLNFIGSSQSVVDANEPVAGHCVTVMVPSKPLLFDETFFSLF